MDASLPKPPSADQPHETPAETKPKIKKPATPAQQAARDKGLKAMMEKRKQISQIVKEKKEKIKVAKKVIEDKIIKEDLGFVTRQDYEQNRSELLGQIAEMKAMLKLQNEREKTPAAPKERIVERIIEKAPDSQPKREIVKLSGHALLDSIFFNK